MRFADYDITPSPLPNDGLMFADLVAKGRSGHLGHALVEYAPGCVLAFYSNCSGVRNDGHNGFGWMEYRRSLDAGQTWDDPRPLPFSVDTFLDGLYTVSCEKAACATAGASIGGHGWSHAGWSAATAATALPWPGSFPSRGAFLTAPAAAA